MKILLILFGILLLQATCDAQTTTAADEEVTGSGDGEDPTTPTTVDPCASNPCYEWGTVPGEDSCTTNEDGDYVCKCDDGWTGKQCSNTDKGCPEQTIEVSNRILHNNVDDCTTYDENSLEANVTLSVVFPPAVVGTMVSTNMTCTETCDGTAANRPVGVMTCEKDNVWSQPRYSDCALTSGEQSTSTKLVNSQIETANPENITSTVINNTIGVMEEVVEGGSVTETDADGVVTLTNNLLQSTKAAPRPSEKERMIAALDDLADAVDLSQVDVDYDQYLNVQSDTGFAVVGAAATSRVFDDATYYFGADGEWGFNLAASSIALSKNLEPNGSYIAAKPASGATNARLSFKIYSTSDNLFPALGSGIVVNKFVLSANGTSTGDFEFRFELTRKNFSLEANSSFDIIEGNGIRTYSQLQCIVWDRANNKWDTDFDSCTANQVDNGYATCSCSQPGEYTMREITYTDPVIIVDEEGLSPGAIAGIVIGSVAAAALIGGGLYYFLFYKKKKAKRSAVTPVDTNEMEMHGHDNDVDDD